MPQPEGFALVLAVIPWSEIGAVTFTENSIHVSTKMSADELDGFKFPFLEPSFSTLKSMVKEKNASTPA